VEINNIKSKKKKSLYKSKAIIIKTNKVWLFKNIFFKKKYFKKKSILKKKYFKKK
jgi:hypothetical protein